MPKQIGDLEKKWYVLHTYSGYEDNVSRNLKQRIESMEIGSKREKNKN
jgi:transcriptional antiterminator NusG